MCPQLRDRARRGRSNGRPRTRRARPGARNIRRGWPRRPDGSEGASARRMRSGTWRLKGAKHFLLPRRPRDEQAGEAVALDQLGELRFETRHVLNVLVDLHPGSLIVAAPQESSADAGDVGELALQLAYRHARPFCVLRGHAIVDVEIELQSTA